MEIIEKEQLKQQLHQIVIDLVGKYGGPSAFARLIGVRQGHVSNWLHRNKKIPADPALLIEEKLGEPKHKVRPDIWKK